MKRWPLSVKVGFLCLIFSILGYILGCFAHSEFFHFFQNLFNALPGDGGLTISQVAFLILGA